jgi:hopanoid-associated phosphorylase
MILAAVGLLRERRIVVGPGVEAVVGGGDRVRLETLLEARASDARGVISIGIAGGLAPGLQVGQWVLADAIIADGEKLPTDVAWTERLGAQLSGSATGSLLGVDAVVAEPADKANLHRSTGALAADMESHVAARVACRHGLAFAAARVVCDPAHSALPSAARACMTRDGGNDPWVILRSLFAQPSQLPALIVTAWNAELSFRSLLGGCRRLGPRLCGPDIGKPSLDVV